VDAFCDSIAFSADEVKELFKHARSYGFDLRLHAEQLSYQAGAVMAAKLGALSVDHLEYLTKDDCSQLAHTQTVAVLLPGAYYFLKQKQVPPIENLRHYGIPMAIASDSNPGSSPFYALTWMMNLACLNWGIQVEEAWLGVTRHAAQALGWQDALGQLNLGLRADLLIWPAQDLEQPIYQPELRPFIVIKSGSVV
jgi:imidazolonepropionase